MAKKFSASSDTMSGRKTNWSCSSISIKKNKKCPHCVRTCSSNNDLKKHLQTHLPDGERTKFKCSVEPCKNEYAEKVFLGTVKNSSVVFATPSLAYVYDNICSKIYYEVIFIIIYLFLPE